MNHTGITSNGPKCFGTTKRTSFVDVRDNDIPGPGTHDANRIDKHTPSKWKFGKGTQRDTFLEKHPRPNPAPSQYNPKVNLTTSSHPCFTIPYSEVENPAEYKEDDGSVGNYSPKPNYPKLTLPKYSFGYFQQNNYSTKVPAPNSYNTDQSSVNTKSQFNKTQNNFTRSNRPLPYGEEGKNPGIAKYEINNKDPMEKPATVFGKGNRPNYINSRDAPGIFYEGGDDYKNLKKYAKGYTMRPYYERVKSKDLEGFPAPNHYNPKDLQSRQKIITYQSERSQLFNKDHVKYPSPQKHTISPQIYQKNNSQSFTQQPRYSHKPNHNPGPGTHEHESPLNVIKGYMGKKIKNLPEFKTPGANYYNPNYKYNKHLAQRTINYSTKRTDFSRSGTGNVGPGDYESSIEYRSTLGKISQSHKFPINKNQNPGPGNYEIPTTIGKLPKYYCGKKKLTAAGLSTHALTINERKSLLEERARAEERKKQEQLQAQSEEDAQQLQSLND